MDKSQMVEIQPYLILVSVLVSSILALILAATSKKLIAKGWLVAFATLNLINFTAFRIIDHLGKRQNESENYDAASQIYQWFEVFGALTYFATACLGVFLLLNWSASRVTLNSTNLFFSFKGRIPRSVFWIVLLIMFPLGTLIGLFPFTTDSEGLPKIFLWIIYLGYAPISTWIAFAIYAKRWHDMGKSGWMTLLFLIPLVGPLFIIYMGIAPGERGPNRYGEAPLEIATE